MSPLPEEQGPTLDPRTHWCANHLEPFRPTWGQSMAWVLATLGMIQEIVRRPEIIHAAGGDARMLDRVLREFAPLCCYLGDETTDRWTQLALGPLEEWKKAHEEIKARPDGD